MVEVIDPAARRRCSRSVTLAAAVGGHRKSSDNHFEGWEVQSSAIECAIADVMLFIRITAEAIDTEEYDVRVGIEWAGQGPLIILTTDTVGHTYDRTSTPLHRYTPVETTVNAIEPAPDYHWHVHDLAQDCVEGGISNLQLIRPPARDDER